MKRAVTLALALCTTSPGAWLLRAREQAPITLAFSSYLGGGGYDEATDVVVDNHGFVYISGASQASDGTFDALIVKLTPDGSRIVFARRFGGSGFDIASHLALDPSGGVYVVGHTTSPDLPMIRPFQQHLNGTSDLFVAKVSRGGALVFSSYYGGSSFENGTAIAVGPTGAIYVAGSTGSIDLPGAGGFQPTYSGGYDDGFVLKLGARHLRPRYATYLGGSGTEFVSGLAIDSDDRPTIVGNTGSRDFPLATPIQPAFGGGFSDAFVTTLSQDGRRATFSSFFGGVASDSAIGIAHDRGGASYVTGITSSYNFPTLLALQPHLQGSDDAFVMKLEPEGLALAYSTFVGGTGIDAGVNVTLDAQGTVHVAGQTSSDSFPSVGAVPADIGGMDALYVHVSADGQSVIRAVRLGGTAFDEARALAVNPVGDVWLVGRTMSADFPLRLPLQPSLAGSDDLAVSRLVLTESPKPGPRR
jgi:hypothetical protein